MVRQVAGSSKLEDIIMGAMEVVTIMEVSSLRVVIASQHKLLLGMTNKLIHMVATIKVVDMVVDLLKQVSKINMDRLRHSKANSKTTISMLNNLDMDRTMMDLVHMEINSINSHLGTINLNQLL